MIYPSIEFTCWREEEVCFMHLGFMLALYLQMCVVIGCQIESRHHYLFLSPCDFPVIVSRYQSNLSTVAVIAQDINLLFFFFFFAIESIIIS